MYLKSQSKRLFFPTTATVILFFYNFSAIYLVLKFGPFFSFFENKLEIFIQRKKEYNCTSQQDGSGKALRKSIRIRKTQLHRTNA